MNLDALREATEWVERQLRRHGETYGCGNCYRHPGDPCQQRRALEAYQAVLSSASVNWCWIHDATAKRDDVCLQHELTMAQGGFAGVACQIQKAGVHAR